MLGRGPTVVRIVVVAIAAHVRTIAGVEPFAGSLFIKLKRYLELILG